MQKIPTPLTLFMLPVLMLVLMGCPIGLDYSPAEPGSEKFDKKLIGTWRFQPTATVKDAEVIEMTFERVDNNTMKAIVKERGEMYSLETDELLGYETEVNGLHVLFFKPENESKYYHYQYKLDGENTLITADIALLDGGVDAVTSSETLRDQITRSMSKPDFYKETITYKRVK
jgi:hypothetical protein